MLKRSWYLFAGFVALIAIIWFAWPTKNTQAPTVNTTNMTAVNVATDVDAPVNSPSDFINFSTADIPDRDPAFEFTMAIPKEWRVEYLSESTAVNFYQPQTGTTTLQQSQLVVFKYSGSTFQFPSRKVEPVVSSTSGNAQAMRDYSMSATTEKTPTGYPTWWSSAHHVTDIQIQTTNPSNHLVLHFAPTISTELRDILMQQAVFGTE